jgi:hypothetical protein
MMYQKNGLFFAVKALIVLILLASALPTTVFAQSDLAARVQIQGPDDKFGDVLLVRDGDDVIIYGLSGSVPPSSEVTITAPGNDTHFAVASYAGKFPVTNRNPMRIVGGMNVESVQIDVVEPGTGIASSGTINLDITGPHILQALQDYSSEVDKVLKGEKTTIDAGMPPHILLDITADISGDQSFVGKVLLTQRLKIQKSGDTVTTSLIDQFEGLSDAGMSPEEIRSVPSFSTIGLYGVPVDVDSPDIRSRYLSLTTTNFVNGNFISNGSFLPYSTGDVNSFNKDTINENPTEVTPKLGEITYLRIYAELTPGADGNPPKTFLAQMKNDVSAGIVGDLTITNNNETSADAPGANGIAIVEGVVDPYGIVTAYAGNDTDSEWVASAEAGPDGSFSLLVPQKAEFNAITGEFDAYVLRQVVYLHVADPFANESDSLTEALLDDRLVAPDPIATEQPDGTFLVVGTTEPASIVQVLGRIQANNDFFWLDAAGKSNDDGTYEFTVDPYYEFQVVIVDQAGNQGAITIPGKQSITASEPTATEQPDGSVIISGSAEPNAIVYVEGRNPAGDNQYNFVGEGLAGADGTYSLTLAPYYEYRVELSNIAGNVVVFDIPGDQNTKDPDNISAESAFPLIRITGNVEPFANVISYGFDAGQEPADPQPSDTLPEGAFFLGGANLENPETTAQADANGDFELFVSYNAGTVVYLHSTDPAGNQSRFMPASLLDDNGDPIGKSRITLTNIVITNNVVGVNDLVAGQTVNSDTGNPEGGFVVAAFRDITTETAALIPFVDRLTDLVPVDRSGNFTLSVPDRSSATNNFVESFYIVAFVQFADGTLDDVGFAVINENDGLNRRGPEILFNPSSSDVVLTDNPKGIQDVIDVNRIYPSGTGSTADLPVDALPFIVVLSDGGDDDEIDVNDPSLKWVNVQPLDAVKYDQVSFFPKAGCTNISIGDNYWDAATQSVVGETVVFVSLLDSVGNLSPNPIPVFLDVQTKDPDVSLISASGTSVVGDEGAVEAFAYVTIFENSDRSGFIATTQAGNNGAFSVSGLSISQDYVYIAAKDAAGNQSNVVQVQVDDPVSGEFFFISDSLATVHSNNTSIPAGDRSVELRRISKVGATIYGLYADGYIAKISGQGAVPTNEEMIILDGTFARDIEVVSADPFQAYVLLGNGMILTYGDVPFYGDIAGDSSSARLPLDEGRQFVDINGNGEWDTEDANGNGVLDITVDIGGVLRTEDTGIDGIDGSAGNAILDFEPIIDIDSVSSGFGWDIARALDLVQDDDGTVKGYVFMDGFGVNFVFGDDIDAQNATPNSTNGYSTSDIFVDLELIVEDGKIVDFITMNGFGQLFGLPSDQGGVLGAGPTTDDATKGFLSAEEYDILIFDFNIARDLEFSSVDTNGDGTIDWQDGWYVLQGLGGVIPQNNANALIGTPFLGLDIARDLEF